MLDLRPANAGFLLLVNNETNMEISREKHDKLFEIIEDAVEYFCDEETVSGEISWTIVECMATAKLAELQGLLVVD